MYFYEMELGKIYLSCILQSKEFSGGLVAELLISGLAFHYIFWLHFYNSIFLTFMVSNSHIQWCPNLYIEHQHKFTTTWSLSSDFCDVSEVFSQKLLCVPWNQNPVASPGHVLHSKLHTSMASTINLSWTPCPLLFTWRVSTCEVSQYLLLRGRSNRKTCGIR